VTGEHEVATAAPDSRVTEPTGANTASFICDIRALPLPVPVPIAPLIIPLAPLMLPLPPLIGAAPELERAQVRDSKRSLELEPRRVSHRSGVCTPKNTVGQSCSVLQCAAVCHSKRRVSHRSGVCTPRDTISQF